MLSSTEIKYVALSEGRKKIVWLWRVPKELGTHQHPTERFEDNKDTVKWCNDHMAESFRRRKYVDL